jgi:hypothetical protein
MFPEPYYRKKESTKAEIKESTKAEIEEVEV